MGATALYTEAGDALGRQGAKSEHGREYMGDEPTPPDKGSQRAELLRGDEGSDSRVVAVPSETVGETGGSSDRFFVHR